MIGAPFEKSNATGVNGDQNNELAPASGAVYLFDLDSPLGVSYCGPAVPSSLGGLAWLRVDGSADAQDEELLLTASDLPPGNVCLFLASRNRGFIPAPGSSCGNLCLMGPDLARFKFDAQIVSDTGQCALDVDPFLVLTNPPQPILNGQTWFFQAWYRDPGASPVCNNNFTDAAEVTFAP